MVHNGIEYGLMAAYAEGLNLLGHTAPYGFDIDVPAVTEVWRRGSVVGSWLLDLTAAALVADPELSGFQGVVSDSGEGRWSLEAAVDLGVPAPVLASALFSRFTSRGEETLSNKILSAMRNEFGGHVEGTRPVTDAADCRRPRRRAMPWCCSASPATSASRSCCRRCTTWPRTGRLDVPVIGVASSEWTTDDFRARLRAALEAKDAHPRPRGARRARVADDLRAGRLRRHGHLRASSTSVLGDAKVPVVYFAIPPSLFPDVIAGLASVGLNDRARVVLEKPLGRDLASARELNATVPPRSPTTACSASTTSSARSRCSTCWCSGSPTRCSNRCGTATTSAGSRSPWPRQFGVEGRGRFYDGVGTMRDVVENHLLQIVALLAMEPPVVRGTRGAARREGQGAARRCATVDPALRGARPVRGLPRRGRRRRRLRHRDLRRGALRHRQLAVGGRALVRAGGQGACPRPSPRRSSSSSPRPSRSSSTRRTRRSRTGCGSA